jgi:hypothetical protein
MSADSTLVEIGAIATPAVTALGLLFAGIQLRGARRVARCDFMLHVDKRFADFADIQMRLKNPAWTPDTEQERFALGRFLALFERIHQLVREKLLEISVVNKLYGWRLERVLQNDHTRTEIEANLEGWQDLIVLWHSLDELRTKLNQPALCPGHAAPTTTPAAAALVEAA